MSKQKPNPGTMSGIDTPDEPNAQNETNLKALELAQVDKHLYRVLNRKKGTQYLADVSDGTCTCEDMQYNQDDTGACKHLEKAILVAPSTIEATDFAARDLQVLSERARNLLWDLRDTTDWVETVIESEAVSQASKSVQNGDSVETPNGENVSSISAADAAKKLQHEFDNTTDGINVEHNGGKVWVNKTPQAPDYTFDAFLSNPDLMIYNPDDQDSPGQYFANYLEPENVDEYISEVLQ